MMTRRGDAIGARLWEERGFTVVEVVVAALILTFGALGVLAIGDTASRNTFRAEQSQVVVNRLQAELEHIRQLPFSEVALSAQPSSSSDPGNPGSRVSGTTFALNEDGTNPRPLAINGGTTPGGTEIADGAIDPGPEEFVSGDVHGRIYRYVAFGGAPADCDGCSADDLKRVVIAVELNSTATGGERIYQEVQSEIANPDTAPADNDLPETGGEEGDDVATFWLTDTPCDQTSRQPLAGNHNLHNTRGICSQGLQTGPTKGAPDLMFNAQPPETDAGTGTVYDYATDVEPAQNPLDDIGTNVLKQSSSSPTGCLLNAPLLSQLDFPALSTETEKQKKVHMWLSNPLNSDLQMLTSADATLEMWTKSINGASYSGRLCIWVFKRFAAVNLLGQTVTVDIPALNVDPPLTNVAHFEFQRNTWPQAWSEISVPMHFIWAADALNVLSGLTLTGPPRLGLAITVDRGGTSGTGIEFMYDHPDFESRLEVQNDQGFSLLGD
jgi:hypothetical protein